MATEQRLREFMETYEACFSKPITPEDAAVALTRLMALFRQLGQPLLGSTTEALDSSLDVDG